MTASPVTLDAADFLGASPEHLARAVIKATLPLETRALVEPLVAYYAARLPVLGMDLQQAVAAIAAITPSARSHLGQSQDELGCFGADALTDLRAEVLGAADAARHGMIEQAFDRAARCGCGMSQPAAKYPAPGEVRVHPAEPGVAHAYLNTEPRCDWRAGLTSARCDVALLLAGRDAELGLLLGPGMVFSGAEDAGAGEMLPPGLVLCGPGANLPPGRYWLDADIWLDGMDRLQLDIASNQGLRRLADMELRGAFRMTLGFEVGAEDEALELRLTNETGAAFKARINRLAIWK